MLRKVIISLVLLIIAVPHLFFKPPVSASEQVEQFLKQQLANTIHQLDEMKPLIKNKKSNASAIRQSFIQLRLAYKQIEFLMEYYYPHLIRRINGPALPFADGENSFAVLQPQGFQVMEEMIFPVYNAKRSGDLLQQVKLLQQIFSDVLYQTDPYSFQDKYVMDAVRLEVYRLIALGITGYDSPLALNSIPEANAVIISLKKVINIYLPAAKDELLALKLNKNLDEADTYLLQHTDFINFDRLHFITSYADPLSEKLLELSKNLQLILPEERRLLSPFAPHLFATTFYNPNVYSPNEEANANPQKILLGEKLFYDTILSGNMQRSCATCHQPQKAFTDGLSKSIALNNTGSVARNAPTLWNAAFQSKQFYDSRAVFMEDQVFDVLHNAREMGSSLQVVVQRIKKDSSYINLFNKAYAYSNEPLGQDNVTNAIASYLRSLVSLNSRFDKYMNGNNNELDDEEKKGFNLFMGKAKCATCHFVPFFNGVAPPYFSESESEVLGVPATKDTVHPLLDDDEGKFNLYPVSILRYAFKTPTLRNIALTAPYMHNGVYETLEEVIDFYDKGGGAGLGIAPANQTLPKSPLNLTKTEKKELITFLHSLTDTAKVNYKQQNN